MSFARQLHPRASVPPTDSRSSCGRVGMHEHGSRREKYCSYSQRRGSHTSPPRDIIHHHHRRRAPAPERGVPVRRGAGGGSLGGAARHTESLSAGAKPQRASRLPHRSHVILQHLAAISQSGACQPPPLPPAALIMHQRLGRAPRDRHNLCQESAGAGCSPGDSGGLFPSCSILQCYACR